MFFHDHVDPVIIFNVEQLAEKGCFMYTFSSKLLPNSSALQVDCNNNQVFLLRTVAMTAVTGQYGAISLDFPKILI